MNILDKDIESAIDYEWFIFNKPQEGISKKFIENIKEHLKENEDKLLYIRLPSDSKSFTNIVPCYKNLYLNRTTRTTELNKIGSDAQNATETCKLGIAVGEKITFFIAFNSELPALDSQVGKFKKCMLHFIKKNINKEGRKR